MSVSCGSPSSPLSVEIYRNLELAEKADHAFAYKNGFAIAVQRSDKWGYPPFMMCTGRTHSHPVTLRTRSRTKVNKTSGL